MARVGELVSGGPHRVEIRCDGRPVVAMPAAIAALLTRIERPEETAFVLEQGERLDEVLRWMLQAGVRLRAVTPQRSSLEDLYVAAAQAGVEPSRDRRPA